MPPTDREALTDALDRMADTLERWGPGLLYVEGLLVEPEIGTTKLCERLRKAARLLRDAYPGERPCGACGHIGAEHDLHNRCTVCDCDYYVSDRAASTDAPGWTGEARSVLQRLLEAIHGHEWSSLNDCPCSAVASMEDEIADLLRASTDAPSEDRERLEDVAREIVEKGGIAYGDIQRLGEALRAPTDEAPEGREEVDRHEPSTWTNERLAATLEDFIDQWAPATTTYKAHMEAARRLRQPEPRTSPDQPDSATREAGEPE